MTQRGFTILDVTLAAGLFAVLIGGAAASVIVDKRTEGALPADLGREMKAHRTVEGLARRGAPHGRHPRRGPERERPPG